MSEEKIIKHTKNAASLLKDRTKSYKEKIKEFFEEIVVIIVAVSITLMFHNWNDERHENEIARNFLKGITHDLKQGADSLAISIKHYQPTIDYYNNVLKQLKLNKIDAPYVDSLSWNLKNTSYFVFDNSRFEGFKSSGYLRLIENEQLLKQIVTMYAIALPFEKEADAAFYHSRYEDFNKYIGIRADVDTAGNFMVSKLLNDRSVRYQYINYAQILEERKRHRQNIAKRMLTLAAEIDKELEK
jgi:hypothetical protein